MQYLLLTSTLIQKNSKMATRLLKVCRELNVGLINICEFLERQGYHVEHSPSAKITDEQYSAICKEFRKTYLTAITRKEDSFTQDANLTAISWKEDSFTQDANKNREFVNSHGWNNMRGDTFVIFPHRIVLIPKDQSCTNFKYWSEHDIRTKCVNAIGRGTIAKEKLCAPSGEIPVLPYVAYETDKGYNAPKTVFKTKSERQKIKTTIKGQVDLSILNSSTRPLKKSKDERRRQRAFSTETRDSNIKQHSAQSNLSQDAIRDVWQNYVDIQEQLIRQRCSPISIIPDSIDLDAENDKLYVTVDETGTEQRLDAIFKDKLGLESYDLNAQSILVDEERWASLSETDLEYIRKTLAENYIELDTTPTINATINYGGNMNRCDQLSLVELRQLDKILQNSDIIEGSIDDTAAFISKVSVDSQGYLEYLFGSHYTITQKKKKNEETVSLIERIEYLDKFIPWDVMQEYSNIGLKCKQYTIIAQVKNAYANDILKSMYDCYSYESDSYKFSRIFTKKDPCHNSYIQEVNENILAFISDAATYCAKKDIHIHVLFEYTKTKRQLIQSKLAECGQYLSSLGQGYSFNNETGAIGIDFNWREQTIDDMIGDIENAVPFVKVPQHEDHRYKCNVKLQLKGLEKLGKALTEKYEDIRIENDSVKHQVIIRLPYLEPDFYNIKRASLENDLLQLAIVGVEIKFEAKEEGKVRLNVRYNQESKLEDLEDRIVNMRKADFGIMLEDKEISFGKLNKANYPDLVFDIDVDNEDKKSAIIEAFNNKLVTTIIPILTGDLEKTHRLKETFTKATTGEELVNPRLQRFIFNSSEATKTDDIDAILRKDGFVYKDICAHLLNKQINDPQKEAIIKAMYADDLAVIQGPPGTGKSTAIAELIWQLIRNGFKQGNKKERILLTSETNLAVDNAISRIINSKTNLVKPIRFGGEEKLETEGLQFSLELMKRWVDEGDGCLQTVETVEETDTGNECNLILKNWLANISKRSFYRMDKDDNDIVARWHNYLEHPSKELREIVFKHYVENANVVGATCSSIGDRRGGGIGYTSFYHNYCEIFNLIKKRARIEFTTVIQDESSKATPAELVLPFVYGQKGVVIGDHRQLPPMLDKEEFDETLDFAFKIAKDRDQKKKISKLKSFVDNHFHEMEVSHFQRLYENIDTSLKGTFNLQYRMHPDINDVIKQFYREDGGLNCGLINPIDLGVNDPNINNPASRYHGIEIPGVITPNTHVLFVDTSSPEMLDGTSRVNYGEVDVIDKLLTRFENSNSFHEYLGKFDNVEDRQIGIISFYGKQIKQLRAVANKHADIPTRVSTVDRFQGMERNIVIVSMVRSYIIQGSQNQQPDWKRYPEEGYPLQKSLGFAQSPNRLNVALSRAKRLLIIVGNRRLFSSLEIYRRLFLTIDGNNNNNVVKQEEI